MLLTLTPGTERRIRREARSETLRARALALRQAGWTLQAIAVAIGVSRTRTQQILRKGERLVLDPHWYDGLPMRVQNFLHVNDLAGLPEAEAAHRIAKLSHRELRAAPNLGPGAVSAVITWLAEHGLKLQPEGAHAFSLRLMRERAAADSNTNRSMKANGCPDTT